MTENEFPFEAFNDAPAADPSQQDVSFVDEFKENPVVIDPVDPIIPAQDNGEPVNSGDPAVDPPVVTNSVAKEEYEKVLSEKQALEDKLSSMSKSELDEHSKTVYEYIKEGKLKELKDFLETQVADYSSKSQSELMKDYLKSTNPEWTNEDINDELESNYGLGLDEDLLSDQERRAYGRKLKADAEEALKFFESKKVSVTLPELTKPAEQAPQQTEEERLAEEKATQEWDNSIVESLKDFTKLSVAVKDDEQFDFAISPEESTKLTEDIKALGKDISIYFKQYITPEGKVDARKLATDMAFLRNKDAIIRSAVTQQVAKANEAFIKGIKNSKVDPSPSGNVVQNIDTIESLVDKMF